jgi:RNA polymerase sigma-70 factor (ECF subfamily)
LKSELVKKNEFSNPFLSGNVLHNKGFLTNLNSALAYIETEPYIDWKPLIDDCILQNRSAQEKLYHHFYPKMMSMVLRYVNYDQKAIAEEILNNGMLKVFQNLGTYKFAGSFEGWVRRIVFHSLSDYIRSTTTYREKTVFIEHDELISGGAASNLGYQELLKLIQQLPQNTRTVFNMYAIDGYTHREIGESLGMSEGTSKWHLFEARKILKKKIEEQNRL